MPLTQMENIPDKPVYSFKPGSPWVEKVIQNAKLLEKHYYLHPKLGNTYRYKYLLDDTIWWIDVDLDGTSMEMWRGDGTCWFEGEYAHKGAAGDDEDDE